MSRQQAVQVLAGSLVLISITLAATVSPWWLLLALFVGLNLAQSGFTGFCPAEKVFARLGLKDRPCKVVH